MAVDVSIQVSPDKTAIIVVMLKVFCTELV